MLGQVYIKVIDTNTHWAPLLWVSGVAATPNRYRSLRIM